MNEAGEIIGLLVCTGGLIAWLFHEIQRGIDTYDEDWGAVVESVYTADLKSAAMSGLRVRVPPALPNIRNIEWNNITESKLAI